MISQLLFIVLLLVGFGFFSFNISKIIKNISLGKSLDRTDNKFQRIKTTLLVALGQKKMFQRFVPALLHLFIYVAFLFTSTELIEIIADGISGSHRFFLSKLGWIYILLISTIEVLSVLAFVSTLYFLARRNLLQVPRFKMSEMTGWPKLDGNIILYLEIVLLVCVFIMNGADEALFLQGKSHVAGSGSFGFLISSFTAPYFFNYFDVETLIVLERVGWWGHILVVFGFLNYLPYSKHFHIVMAFPNTYYSNLNNKGAFNNLSSVKDEVLKMFDPSFDPYATPEEGEASVPDRFGAKDVEDLTWKSLMDAYTCTECGRCTSACPASQTGKLLSPRKIIMDTRDRLEEVGANKRINGSDFKDNKSLLGDYISEEEIWACTSCNACVQECPVSIDPLSIIIDLRRYLVMEESKIPSELTGMLTNIENNGAPWQFAQADRNNWVDE
jgi:heterodisulfide reductase subunit C|tara:strand:+ start:489 stop:1817 length:1329 start_codon:yes stop_codon:yes gene_type:complete